MGSAEIYGEFELVSTFGFSKDGCPRYVVGFTGDDFHGQVLECVSDYHYSADPKQLMIQSLLLSLNTGVKRLGRVSNRGNASQLIDLAQAAFSLGSKDLDSISA